MVDKFNNRTDRLNVGDVFALTLEDFTMANYNYSTSNYPKLDNYEVIYEYDKYLKLCDMPLIFMYLGNGLAKEMSTKKVFPIRFNSLYCSRNFYTNYDKTEKSIFNDVILEKYPSSNISVLLNPDENKVESFLKERNAFIDFYKTYPLVLDASFVYEVNDELKKEYCKTLEQDRVNLLNEFESIALNSIYNIEYILCNPIKRDVENEYIYDSVIKEAYSQNELFDYQSKLRKIK